MVRGGCAVGGGGGGPSNALEGGGGPSSALDRASLR